MSDPYAGIYVQQQAKALQAAGLNISVFFVEQCFFPCIPVWSCKFEEGLPTYRLKAYIPPKRIKPLRAYWYRKWEQLLKKYEATSGKLPGCLHAHSFVGGAAARYLGAKYGIPYIITEHYDGFISHKLPQHWKKELKTIYGDADTVIAVSSSLATSINNYHESVEVIPNMINTNLFYPKNAPDTKAKTINIISVGTLEARKNHALLIRTFSKIKEKRPAKLTIIGDGPLLNALKRQAENLRLGDSIYFTGNLPPAKVADQLRAADLYVSTSKSESFALAPVEAVACGLPVVIMRCGSILENLQLQTVTIVDHEQELEKAISGHLEETGRQEIHQDSKLVRTRFSPETVTARMKSIYDQCKSGESNN